MAAPLRHLGGVCLWLPLQREDIPRTREGGAQASLLSSRRIHLHDRGGLPLLNESGWWCMQQSRALR